MASAKTSTSQRLTTEVIQETVHQARKSALEMMRKAGFQISDKVKVVVDPQLPFMGYTMPQGGNFTIVVSGGADGSGLLEGLLVHEMSHIYRIQTNHPSHNGQILEEAVDNLAKKASLHDYQQKIVHDLLNDIQDLYADGISFKVLRNTPIMASDQMTSFLQDWVKEEPIKSGSIVKDSWTNASIMTHNARAIAQMARHRVEDTGGKAEHTNRRFLSQVSPQVAGRFEYFRNLLQNLREDMTAEEYRALLADYLRQFLEIAERN
jgi:oligoribonuclease (3'-5' exoribonuclease)